MQPPPLPLRGDVAHRPTLHARPGGAQEKRAAIARANEEGAEADYFCGKTFRYRFRDHDGCRRIEIDGKLVCNADGTFVFNAKGYGGATNETGTWRALPRVDGDTTSGSIQLLGMSKPGQARFDKVLPLSDLQLHMPAPQPSPLQQHVAARKPKACFQSAGGLSHVTVVRQLASGQSQTSSGISLLVVEACCADILDLIAQYTSMGADATTLYNSLRSLSMVCKPWREAVSDTSLACALVKSDEKHLNEVLDLSCQKLGTSECYLIALAMRQGLLSASVLWLQGNMIDKSGVRWLTRGFKALPKGASLRSVSLGQNKFHLEDADRAVLALEAAAKRRGVRVRLNS